MIRVGRRCPWLLVMAVSRGRGCFWFIGRIVTISALGTLRGTMPFRKSCLMCSFKSALASLAIVKGVEAVLLSLALPLKALTNNPVVDIARYVLNLLV